MSRVSTKPVIDTEHRPRQHAVRDPCCLPGRDGKACGNGGDHHRNRKRLVPPQQQRGRAKPDRGDAATGSTGSCRQQNRTRCRCRTRPAPKAADAGDRLRRVPIGAASGRMAARRRHAAALGRRPARRPRRPGPGIAPLSARRVALLRHAALHLTILFQIARLPDDAFWAASGTNAET